jgi:hypothetical protein
MIRSVKSDDGLRGSLEHVLRRRKHEWIDLVFGSRTALSKFERMRNISLFCRVCGKEFYSLRLAYLTGVKDYTPWQVGAE